MKNQEMNGNDEEFTFDAVHLSPNSDTYDLTSVSSNEILSCQRLSPDTDKDILPSTLVDKDNEPSKPELDSIMDTTRTCTRLQLAAKLATKPANVTNYNVSLSNSTCKVFGDASPLLNLLPSIAVALTNAKVQHKKWSKPEGNFVEVDFKKRSNSKTVHRGIAWDFVRGFAPSCWDTLIYSSSGFDSVPMNNVTILPDAKLCSPSERLLITAGRTAFLQEYVQRFQKSNGNQKMH